MRNRKIYDEIFRHFLVVTPGILIEYEINRKDL
jgi:hypothetical protein